MTQWIEVGSLEEIPRLGARVVQSRFGDLAVFRTKDDKVFALRDKCPHKGGALSQGIVHGDNVTCPLHNWVISLQDGEAQGYDTGCTRTFQVRMEGRQIFVALTATEESD
ncbi:nitrite reductase small subunit NirD [Hahella sp. NBU794]|uniref:nitrite reductase small subunit NirD n=1 Tax=Hahella sp. NBU794 TaxID=3422590 RepID=UPI003D6E58AD